MGDIQPKKESNCLSLCLQSSINIKNLPPLNSYRQCLGSDLRYFFYQDTCYTFEWFSCFQFFLPLILKRCPPPALIIRPSSNSLSWYMRCFSFGYQSILSDFYHFPYEKLYSNHIKHHKSPGRSTECFLSFLHISSCCFYKQNSHHFHLILPGPRLKKKIVCVYVYICIYICVCIHIYMYAYICVHTYMYI